MPCAHPPRGTVTANLCPHHTGKPLEAGAVGTCPAHPQVMSQGRCFICLRRMKCSDGRREGLTNSGEGQAPEGPLEAVTGLENGYELVRYKWVRGRGEVSQGTASSPGALTPYGCSGTGRRGRWQQVTQRQGPWPPQEGELHPRGRGIYGPLGQEEQAQIHVLESKHPLARRCPNSDRVCDPLKKHRRQLRGAFWLIHEEGA